MIRFEKIGTKRVPATVPTVRRASETGRVSGSGETGESQLVSSLRAEVARLELKLKARDAVRQGDMGMKPWVAAGVSRASYYRDRKAAAGNTAAPTGEG